MIKRLLLLLFFICISFPASAINETPGKGITIRPARAPWNTGYFHALIIEKGLRELGYTVQKAEELPVGLFYKSLAKGYVDYWPNGWFPLNNSYLTEYKDTITPIGYVLKEQALQGYLVDKKHAELLNITSLSDFSRSTVRKAFDKDGDGKADLTGAPSGWGADEIIEHHLKEYDLTSYIELVSVSYEEAMAANFAAYKNGEPIFYYTWVPSWTTYKLVPGKDVVWINVPYNIPTTDSKKELELMRLNEVEGAVTDPIDIGFSVADIRVVANKTFLEQNPPAKKFLELFTIDRSDLNKEYERLVRGEKALKDIDRRADEWISNNQEVWNSWLEQARRTVD